MADDDAEESMLVEEALNEARLANDLHVVADGVGVPAFDLGTDKTPMQIAAW